MGSCEPFEMRTVLEAVADALDVPRNRMGKLSASTIDHVMKQEKLRNIAIQLKVGGCEDTIDQAVKVIRATLKQWEGK